MYVVRPNFFIPIISILRNAAMNSLEVKREPDLIKMQTVDINKFEKEVEDFKKDFGRNENLARRHFEEAIKRIDQSIDNLEKTKEALLLSNKQLMHANKNFKMLALDLLQKIVLPYWQRKKTVKTKK